MPSARCDGAESADIIARDERLAGSEAAREYWQESMLSAESLGDLHFSPPSWKL